MNKTIFALLLIIVLSGCLSPPSNQKVVIGAVLPLTGQSSVYGQYPQEGMQLALDEINATGGINGKPLEIRFEDSTSQVSEAVTATQSLISTQNVPVILTGASSPETLGEAPVAEQNKVVLLAAGSAAPAIRNSGDYIFRLKVSVDKETEALTAFAFNDLNARSIFIIYVQNDYGEGIRKFADESFTKLGGSVLGSEGYLETENDFRAQLLKAKEANADLIIVGGWARSTGWVLKQAEELGINKPFLAPAGAVSPEIGTIAGSAAEKLIFTSEFNPKSEQEETKQFVEKFKQKFNEREPELFAAMGYDSVHLIANALKICDLDSDCIKQKLYETQNYSGVSAVISFDDHGDVFKPITFMTIRSQEFVEYTS